MEWFCKIILNSTFLYVLFISLRSYIWLSVDFRRLISSCRIWILHQSNNAFNRHSIWCVLIRSRVGIWYWLATVIKNSTQELHCTTTHFFCPTNSLNRNNANFEYEFWHDSFYIGIRDLLTSMNVNFAMKLFTLTSNDAAVNAMIVLDWLQLILWMYSLQRWIQFANCTYL